MLTRVKIENFMRELLTLPKDTANAETVQWPQRRSAP